MSSGRSLMPRRIRVRYVVALGATLVLAASLATWTLDRPNSGAESTVSDFVEALNDRDVEAAAELTSYPNAAASSISQMFDGLSAGGKSTSQFELSQFIDLDQDSGFFTLGSAWNFGEGKDWQYSTRGSAKKLSVGWRITWEPDILAPGLVSAVHYTRTDAPPPLVFDAAQNVLMSERTINAVSLDPAQMPDPAASAARLADVIDVVAPLITAESLTSELTAAPGAPVLAVNLRDDDFSVLEDDLRAIPGVVISQTPKLIAGDRRITSPLLDSIRDAWQLGRDATSGWAVDVVGADGIPARQVGFQGPGGPDLHATLDPRIQLAAEDAVVSVGTSASIVAIVPSTGAIVAAAQNSYANEQGQIAFSGMYPTGSATAMLDALQSGENPGTPTQLGLGVNYSMPGLDAFAGQRSGPGGSIDRIRSVGNERSAESMTPFGLAQMGAAISRGAAPLPSIVVGQTAVADQSTDSIPPEALARLRKMLVDSAHAEGLDAYAGLTGFAGNSGDDRWFIANRGDLAFAVYIEDADGTDQAVKMSTRLIRGMDSGIAE
ncbi:MULTISPECIES: NTF2-like N-terminal transpeptidase domain-containing protein [unclassified Rhodococcus (in: high G+C Gram-positive bacteria)]|uniref:NTF2-like N-terminal transpeptidase domain-containing protein n=1 Tax=unclassified Rhodococcus (in: high G+C Gram-positive bacteria) TaxID=192944 RepID=UPI001B34D52D|nr:MULTISPECIES: NTF2-like N-terminal transpeptidase domain-containing protein [unclassified Rhodococcus (in: high G+C Gram-positive bacteria)]